MDEPTPSSSVIIDPSLPLLDMTPYVVALCKDLIKRWSILDDDCFHVETVSGGITNLLLKVTAKQTDGEEVAVTVRLFGPNTDYIIDRERELQAIKYLSAAGFGAQLLGYFGNGTLQSFIDARTLTPSDIRNPKIAAEIARQLSMFHQLEVPGSREPQLWHDIFKFYEQASKIQFDDVEKRSRYETISFDDIHNEVKDLQDLTNLLNSPVVYSHNDLLSGNLMLNDKEEKLYFIDFEYGSYSYRGFDIGNHFNEYAGFECDYSLYPSKEEQYHFFRHYLNAKEFIEVASKDLEAMYVEVNTYMLASHLFWALWALIQAKMSPIDFDYLGYFFLRYKEYQNNKERCFSMARAFLANNGM